MEKGEQLKVVNPYEEEKPTFHMIGTGLKRKGAQTESINFINEITNMTKPEQFVIKNIMDAIGYNIEIGEAYIPTSMFNENELQKWKKGIKALKDKKFVDATKVSHFMINPNAFIPKEYNKALKVWNNIYPPS
jgi:hypothetical protein